MEHMHIYAKKFRIAALFVKPLHLFMQNAGNISSIVAESWNPAGPGTIDLELARKQPVTRRIVWGCGGFAVVGPQ